MKCIKTQQLRTYILKTCYAKISQLSLYKNLFSLRFETGSYFLKLIYEKILYTWAKKISQHSESSLETKVPHHSNCNVRYAGFIRGIS